MYLLYKIFAVYKRVIFAYGLLIVACFLFWWSLLNEERPDSFFNLPDRNHIKCLLIILFLTNNIKKSNHYLLRGYSNFAGKLMTKKRLSGFFQSQILKALLPA